MLQTQLTIWDGIFILCAWLLGAGCYLMAAVRAQRERDSLARRKRAYERALKISADNAVRRVRRER